VLFLTSATTWASDLAISWGVRRRRRPAGLRAGADARAAVGALLPVPTLAEITSAINDLQTAETAALARTKGAVATRNEKRTALVRLLEQLKGNVQTAADANVENGASIIQSAGMALRKPTVRAPRVFAAKPGALSGTAQLVAASAAQRASYEWEYSADGGKTWITAPSTLQAETTVPGLTLGATVQFRYRPVTTTGEGDWSQPVSLIVK
jgi:hypothetical protein